jgi:asparagine synthase (glutamine-hydrolysing)
MSAIFGIWNIDGQPVEEKHLRRMEEMLRHYGRDAQNIKIDGNIGLGCCLNKISRHAASEVPVYTDEQQGTTLVGDALLYNRDELMGKYGLADDEAISTQGLLLAAYQKWGMDCAKNINGDFAFAIWEKQSKQLLIFRDHLGVRPLYYFYNGTTLAFATDYRPLLALPFIGKQLDEGKLYAELSNTYHIDPEVTYFAKIKRLPQAHWLKGDANGISKHSVEGTVLVTTISKVAL